MLHDVIHTADVGFRCACCGDTFVEDEKAVVGEHAGLTKTVTAYGGPVCHFCADDQQFCDVCLSWVKPGAEYRWTDDGAPICSAQCDDVEPDDTRETADFHWRHR